MAWPLGNGVPSPLTRPAEFLLGPDPLRPGAVSHRTGPPEAPPIRWVASTAARTSAADTSASRSNPDNARTDFWLPRLPNPGFSGGLGKAKPLRALSGLAVSSETESRNDVTTPETESRNAVTGPVTAKRNVCAFCGRPFKPSRKDSRFCRPACRVADYRRRNALADPEE